MTYKLYLHFISHYYCTKNKLKIYLCTIYISKKKYYIFDREKKIYHSTKCMMYICIYKVHRVACLTQQRYTTVGRIGGNANHIVIVMCAKSVSVFENEVRKDPAWMGVLVARVTRDTPLSSIYIYIDTLHIFTSLCISLCVRQDFSTESSEYIRKENYLMYIV